MGGKHPISAGLATLADVLERENRRGVSFSGILPETEEKLRRLPRDLANLSRPRKNPPAAPSEVAPARDSGERTEEWARGELNKIYREVKSSETLRSLGTLFDTVVFATGNPLADLVFVGEAPGAQEERERKPFVGPAGRKLTQIVEAMGLSREEVYITNIVKFRPKKGDGRFQGSGNRRPDADEMAASIEYVRREIEVLRPKVIVALGGTAAEGLLDVGGSVSSLREQVREFAGVPVVVSYHPSYVLRQESEKGPSGSKDAKRAVWEDMLKVMELLGMPVSEKQRGYFA